jgi:glycosyltransferase involved in cell wall biosynthesis
VPVYNELKTLPEVFGRLAALPLEKEVVAVDDGSKDGSREWLARAFEKKLFPFELKVIKQERNMGKGRALITGFAAASGGIVIVQDADLEYDCKYIPEIVRPIAEGRADVIYGSRLITGESATYNIFYLWGNQFLTFLVNLFFGSRMTDSYACYKAFSASFLKTLQLSSNGFEIEAEISCNVAFKKARFEEVPIVYASRSRKDGKKINYKDAVKGVLKIIWLRLTL